MDATLVVRAQRGDEIAFAAITQATSGRFKQVSYRILRDRHLAEDATQQALVEIWRTLPKLRDPARFDGWAYRILVHSCYRESKRYKRSFGVEPGERELAGPDEMPTVNDRDQIERGFAQLSVDQRDTGCTSVGTGSPSTRWGSSRRRYPTAAAIRRSSPPAMTRRRSSGCSPTRWRRSDQGRNAPLRTEDAVARRAIQEWKETP